MNWNLSDFIKTHLKIPILINFKNGKKLTIELVAEDNNYILGRFIKDGKNELKGEQVVISKQTIASMYEPKSDETDKTTKEKKFISSFITQTDKTKPD